MRARRRPWHRHVPWPGAADLVRTGGAPSAGRRRGQAGFPGAAAAPGRFPRAYRGARVQGAGGCPPGAGPAADAGAWGRGGGHAPPARGRAADARAGDSGRPTPPHFSLVTCGERGTMSNAAASDRLVAGRQAERLGFQGG
jgi:hypothetical protein